MGGGIEVKNALFNIIIVFYLYPVSSHKTHFCNPKLKKV